MRTPLDKQFAESGDLALPGYEVLPGYDRAAAAMSRARREQPGNSRVTAGPGKIPRCTSIQDAFDLAVP